MSHVQLQRVMVRMLYDAAFTGRVLADAAAELAAVPLSELEREWLVRPDPRAWRADPGRPRRALAVLLQKYPTSFALALASSDGIPTLERYFTSPFFHRAIQDKGSMALEFAEYLIDATARREVRDPRTSHLARLEQAIARLHLDSGPYPPEAGRGADRYRLSRDRALHRGAAGTADLHDEIHAALAAIHLDLAQLVADPTAFIPPRAVDAEREEPLLLELVRDDGPRVRFLVGSSEITEELYALLDFSRTPRSRSELVEQLVELGADPEDAESILEDLIDDGTLEAMSDSEPSNAASNRA